MLRSHKKVMPLDIVKREEWTDHVEKDPMKISHPAHAVWYTVTCTHTCADGETCKQRAKALLREQRLDFKRKDIAYNFLIGGDGKVIEAKGWFDAPDLPVQYLALRHKSIYIAFIGWYNYIELPSELYRIADEVVKYGVENKYINEEMPRELYEIAEEIVKYGIENKYITSKYVLNDLLTPYSRRFRYENGQIMQGYIPSTVNE